MTSEPKVYEVEVSRTLYVVATSREEAEDTALRNERDDCQDPMVHAHHITSRDLLDTDGAQSEPWRAPSVAKLANGTVDQWLDALGVPPRKPVHKPFPKASEPVKEMP